MHDGCIRERPEWKDNGPVWSPTHLEQTMSMPTNLGMKAAKTCRNTQSNLNKTLGGYAMSDFYKAHSNEFEYPGARRDFFV